MGFWRGERCEYCGGSIGERRVELFKRVGRRRVLIRNVPAGVCRGCGTRYFAANILKIIEDRVKHLKRTTREIAVPVLEI